MSTTLRSIIHHLASTGAIGSRERDLLIIELEAGDLETDEWGNTITAADGYWDDLRFPAQGINPAGSPAAATVATSGFPGTLLFADNADNHIAGVAQLPHSWQRGSAIRPHIHWMKQSTASGSVGWEFRYAVADIGDEFGAYSDWVVGTHAVSSNIANVHQLTTFGSIDLTGKGESTMIAWELRRNTPDTHSANVYLLELDFHYQTNKSGTKNEIPS